MRTVFSISSLGALAIVLAGLLATPAKATTIDWGTYFGSTSYLFDSNGANLDDTYVFQLGSFGSFVPTAANILNWAANWKPFDQAMAPVSNGFVSTSGTVGHSATLESDLTTSNTALSQTNTFAEGEQAYIWAFKDTSGSSTPLPVYSSDLQWALVTNDSTDGVVADDWTFPAPSGHIATSLDWRIEDATDSPFGGLNDTQDPGDFTSTPPDFILQTHTIVAVPEPGSALLIGLAGLACQLKRRKTGRR